MSIYKLKNHESGPIPKDELPALQTAIRAMRAARKKLTSKQFDIVSDISDGTIDAIDEKDFKDVPKEDIKKYAEAINLIQESKRQYGEEAVVEVVRKTPDLDENQQPVPLTEQEAWWKPKPHNNKYRLKNDPDSSHDTSNDTPNDNPNDNPDDRQQGFRDSAHEPQPPLPPADPDTPPTEPAGDLPLPTNGDEFNKENVPLPEYDSLTVGVVNQDEDLKAKARYVGESRLAENLTTGNFFKRAAKKVWMGGIARNYYRQKFINEARHDMQTAQNIVLDFDEKDRRRFNNDVCKAFLSEQEGIIDESAGDKRKSLLAENPAIHAEIKDIVSKYASGDINTTEDASRQFKEIIKKLEDGSYAGVNGHIAISNIEAIAIEAKRRYDNLMTVAEAMNGQLSHDEAMARVMAGFDVKYGERRIDRLDPRYNKVDKIVDKIQSSKLGVLISPETAALAAGATTCVVEALGKRVPSLVFAGIPGLSGAIVSGVRASADFEKDRSRALYDTRYSRKFDGEQKRRKEMMKTMHEHHNANDLRNDLAKRIDALEKAKSEGRDTAALQKEMLAAIARYKTYLSMDKTDTPVLSYTSEVNAPSEQLRLLEQIGAAKQCLRDNGVADLDAQLDANSNLMKQSMELVQNNLHETEKIKRKAKVARIAKRAGFSLVTGAAVGVAAQEIRALFDPNLQGVFEKGTGDYSTRLTAGKKLAAMITGKDKATPDVTSNYNLDGSGVVDNSNSIDFVKAKDGTYSLVDGNGKTIANGLDWNSKTGEMTPASMKILQAQGIKVSEHSGVTQTVKEQIATSTTKNVSLKEYFEKTTDNVPSVKRMYWYDNNTKVFDQNELRCYYHTDSSGNNGLITGMFDNGSFHGDKVAEFSKLASNGSIKLMISPTAETQGTPIEVVGKLMPDGQMSFCPEPGTAAAKFFNADGTFIGKYAEIVQDLGKNASGETMIAPLATVVGEGSISELPIIEPGFDFIDNPVDVPSYLFEFPTHDFDFPIMLPFSPEGAMNASRHNTPSRRSQEPGIRTGYGYGYGYEAQQTDDNNLGEVSPRIAEGKKLNMGTELSWYIDDQLQKKGDKDYVESIKREAEKSPVLKSIDNNVKTLITIPVHAPSESENIYRTLSLYANQEGIDFNSVVVLLDVNWRGDREEGDPAEIAANIQATRDRIAQAQRDFPNLKIATMEQPDHYGISDVARGMNDVAMYALNSAVKEGRMSADNDVIVIRNDADMKHLSKNYLASYQKAAEENPKTPLFTGSSWFDIGRQKITPGFAATQVFERINNMFGAFKGDIHTEGRNFAYRASHFAAMNGYGFEADGVHGWSGAASDDLRVGWRMKDAFRDAYIDRVDGSTSDSNNELMDAKTQMLVRVGGAEVDTDDNRQLRFYIGGVQNGDRVTDDAYGDQFGGYNASPIRPEAIKGFVEDLTDRQRYNGLVAQFEREMSRFFTRAGDKRSSDYRVILSWFFDVPESNLDNYFSVEDDPGRGNYYKFTLSDAGKQRLREALVARFGDGFSTDDRNTLQKAIAENKWITPVPNPTS